ncbi:hypothetical protein FB45DRAFT_939560 [Roridomyces roridus]|uniref:C2H2-type domain-containing protein n=1 Tax=Roridomyces roridus TaxID=1738132 RepID=A0AAD7B823_9AGAR|nr:hypothetical protein FB45DRAFT_939560 [Roridomyces roridus]
MRVAPRLIFRVGCVPPQHTMLLNLPVEDLLSSSLDINLGQTDGRLSCNIKPRAGGSTPTNAGRTGITLNLESVRGDKGFMLRLYASHEEPHVQPPPPSTPAVVASTPSDSGSYTPSEMQDFSHNMDDPMSFFSAPPDYFSGFSSKSTESFADPSSSCNEYPLHGEALESRFAYDFARVSTELGGSHYDAQGQFCQLISPESTVAFGTISPTDTDGSMQAISSPSNSPHSSSDYDPTSPDGSTSSAISSTDPSRCNSPAPSPTDSAHIPSFHPTPVSISEPEAPSTGRHSKTSGKSNTTSRRAQYPCLHPTCGRVLTSLYTRQVHMGTHRAKARKAFICTLGCGEAFTRQHDRQRHEVALHGKQCQHVCQRCRRFFSSAQMLDRHVCRGLGSRTAVLRWPVGAEEETSPEDGITP